MTNNEKKEWLQRYRECWAEVEITQQEIEELNSRAQMLMCGKVTHKNLIDSSPLFRKNIISKPSRASQRQVNGLSPTVDSPVCPCWWIIKGRQQKVLPPFPIIKERERLHD